MHICHICMYIYLVLIFREHITKGQRQQQTYKSYGTGIYRTCTGADTNKAETNLTNKTAGSQSVWHFIALSKKKEKNIRKKRKSMGLCYSMSVLLSCE